MSRILPSSTFLSSRWVQASKYVIGADRKKSLNLFELGIDLENSIPTLTKRSLSFHLDVSGTGETEVAEFYDYSPSTRFFAYSIQNKPFIYLSSIPDESFTGECPTLAKLEMPNPVKWIGICSYGLVILVPPALYVYRIPDLALLHCEFIPIKIDPSSTYSVRLHSQSGCLLIATDSVCFITVIDGILSSTLSDLNHSVFLSSTSRDPIASYRDCLARPLHIHVFPISGPATVVGFSLNGSHVLLQDKTNTTFTWSTETLLSSTPLLEEFLRFGETISEKKARNRTLDAWMHNKGSSLFENLLSLNALSAELPAAPSEKAMARITGSETAFPLSGDVSNMIDMILSRIQERPVPLESRMILPTPEGALWLSRRKSLSNVLFIDPACYVCVHDKTLVLYYQTQEALKTQQATLPQKFNPLADCIVLLPDPSWITVIQDGKCICYIDTNSPDAGWKAISPA